MLSREQHSQPTFLLGLKAQGLLLSFALMLFSQTGCDKALQITQRSNGSITGSATMFSLGTLSTNSNVGSFSGVCSSATVSVHKVENDGSINDTVLAAGVVDANGSYTIANASAAGISVTGTIQYVIKAEGCGAIFYRPLTDLKEQKISGGSTLLALAATVDDIAKRSMTDVERAEVLTAIADFDGLAASDLTTLLDQIILNATLKNKFLAVTNITPEKLKELAPPYWELTVPENVEEGMSTSYSTNVSHWNTDYDAAYEWKLDGVVVSDTSTWTYQTSQNAQGTHALIVSVGSNDGSGGIDTSKAVRTQTFSVHVSNDYPAVAPTLTISGSTKRRLLAGTANIATGPLMINCDSFSALAITEDPIIAPVLAIDYPITCTQSGLQSEAFTLSAGDGPKTLALWVIDAAGNASSLASTATVLLDQTNPSLSLGALANLKGGSSRNLTYSASDATSGLQTLILEYAANGTTFVPIADLMGATSPYAWTVPTVDIAGAKMRISATDQAGNSSQVESAAFSIDSTAPTITILTPSADTHAQTGVTITGACEDGIGVVIDGTGITTPTTISCSSGSYSEALTFTAGDGVKNVRVRQTDAAGNIGSTNRNFFKDTTAPDLAFSSPAAGQQAKSGLIITGICEDGGSNVAISGTGVSAPSSVACSSGIFSTNITFSAVDGTKTVDISQSDSAGNSATDTRDFVRNNAAPSMTLTGPPANKEAKTGVTLTGTCDDSFAVDVAGSGITNAGAFTCTSGTFSIPITFTGVDGTKSVSVSQTDGIGNTVNVDRDFIRDNVAPNIVISTPAISTAAQSGVTVTGTCETGYNVVFSGTGLANPGSATCTASAYTYNATFTANDGTKNIVVTQTDQAGNIGTTNRNFVKDTTGPIAPVITLVSSSPSNLTAVQIGITCDADFDKVIYQTSDTEPSVGDAGWETCATPKTVTAATGDGTKTFYVFAKDTLGNISPSSSVSMILDQTIPSVSLTSLNTAQVLKGGTTTAITWSASDTNLGATPIALDYSSNSGTNWTSIATGLANSGSYTWTIPSLNSTTFKVRVRATDTATNTNTAVSSGTFTVDSTAPILTLTSLDGDELLKGGSTVAIKWTATDVNFGSNPIAIHYSSNGGSTWTSITASQANSGTYNWSVPLIDSSDVYVRISSTDLAGNNSSVSSSSPFTIDSSAPSVTLTSLTGGQVIAGNVARSITWSATDANLGSNPVTIDYSANSGGAWTNLVTSGANTGSYTWSVAVADGTHYRVRVKVVDQVGWSTTAASTSDFIVNSDAPSLTQTTLTSPYISTGNTVTFGGACDLTVARMGANTDITVSGAGMATVACSGSAPTGTWSWTTSAETTDAIRTYNFSQTTVTSLTTTVSASWVRSTTAPAVTYTVANNNSAYLQTTLASVTVTAADPLYSVGLQVRVAATSGAGANCQTLYADDNWNAQINTNMTWSVLVPDGDGVKKVCAWAKNAAGLVSVISPNTGTLGVNMDTIQYANATPPQITSFSVTNPLDGSTNFAAGDVVKISWSATDSLGFDNNPIKLEYTSNGTTWIPIESAYGSLSGNPTSYTHDYYGFSAPTGGFLRVRLTAKNVAGQLSNMTLSQALNGGQWSVYAGNKDRGLGGTAKGLLLFRNYALNSFYTISPKTNDIYIIDEANANSGLIKIDGKTGLSSLLIRHASSNLTDGGVITPGVSTHSVNYSSVTMDSNGYLYFNVASSGGTALTSSTVWQMDPSTNIIRKYIGGSNNSGKDGTAIPSTVFSALGQLAFDESNSMYFFAGCDNPFVQLVSGRRLMKVTQVNGVAATVSVVAGNCAKGAVVNGANATDSPITNYAGNLSGYSLAVWNNGANIYYQMGNEAPVKIVNGKIYTTAIPALAVSVGSTGYITYNSKNGKIYRVANSVQEWTTSTTTNGEVFVRDLVTSSGTGACSDDGTDATDACVNASNGITTSPQGKVLFTDNMSSTGGTGYRVRYVDDQGKVRTLVGAPGHYGESLDKSLARTNFGGLYYKKSSEPNDTAYPEGLYFKSYSGQVFGRIETDGTMTSLWGNQAGDSLATYYPTGTQTSKYLSMGYNETFTMDQVLNFDKDGLPWMGYQKYIVSLDADAKVVVRSTTMGSGNQWDYRAPGTAVSGVGFYSTHSFAQNLTLKDQGYFLLGRHTNPPTFPNDDPVMRFVDYGNSEYKAVMGGNGSTTMSNDSVTAGSVSGFNMGNYCTADKCAMQYIAADDTLYFSDGATLRKLISPTTPVDNFLSTIFTVDGGSVIQNFTIRPDGSQVFYTKVTGLLFCYPLTAGGVKTWCNATSASLGPTTGLAIITKGPNQFTWKDNLTLFVNNYAAPAEIYQFDVPTIP